MSLIEHARKELELAGFFDKETLYEGMLGKSVMELIEVFAKQGHSGASGPLCANVFNKVAKYGNLSPIQNQGWSDHGQNKRCSALFKDEKGAYYLDAIVWKGEEDFDTFTGTVEGIHSRQYVKFPFIPKTFYIDVIEKDGEHFIKDKKQLDEVFQYYNKYE